MKIYRLKNILVPIDFSPTSRHALHHAERIGELIHARITLLHVVEPFVDSMGMDAGTAATAARLIDELQARGSVQLQKMARALGKRTGGQVRTVTAIGRIAPTIGKQAEETGSDLIIMGTHGASGFVENVIGSNAYRVATLSRVPVLSVHKRIPRHGYKHIVYPVRGNVRAMDKFTHALAFAKLFKARVHVVGLPRPGRSATEDRLRVLCTTIQRRFINNGIEAEMVFTSSPQLAEAVIRYAQVYSGSLVVINQDYDFRLVELFQATFPKKILHRVLSPVLTVPK